MSRPCAATPSTYRQARLPAHLALRIALAARALRGVDTARLLRAVIAAVGEPITEARLAKLRASRLSSRLMDVGSGDEPPLTLTDRQLHSALGLLKGRGVSMPEAPLPVPAPYREGELPESVRVACSSDSGESLDGLFSTCTRFLIYQISPRESRLIDIREPGPCPAEGDRHGCRALLLSDCQLLYTLSIGGPAAAKVIRAGVHPIKLTAPLPARDVVDELQRVLAGAPPPWLAKAMGVKPGERVRFISNHSG